MEGVFFFLVTDQLFGLVHLTTRTCVLFTAQPAARQDGRAIHSLRHNLRVINVQIVFPCAAEKEWRE